MEKTDTSTTLAPRKRKQSNFFSSLSHQEEKLITRALQVSFKKIPSNNDISEDEDEDEDEDFNEVEPSDLEDDVQAETNQYETKWGITRLYQPGFTTHMGVCVIF